MYKARGQINRQELTDPQPMQIQEERTVEKPLPAQTPAPRPRKRSKPSHMLLLICALLLFVGVGGAYYLQEFGFASIGVDDLTAVTVNFNVNSQPQQVATNSSTVEEFLSEQGIKLSSKDYISLEMDQPIVEGMNIWLRLAVYITVEADGKTTTLHTQPITAKQALQQAGVTLGQYDQLSLPLLRYIYSDTTLTVARVTAQLEVVNDEIPFESTKKEVTYLTPGSTAVLTQGAVGILASTYNVTYRDGVEIGREFVSSEVTKEPVTEVIGYGPVLTTAGGNLSDREGDSKNTDTKDEDETGSDSNTETTNPAHEVIASGKKVATTESGESFYYTETYQIETTAYTWTGNQTFTGTWPKVGTIAVDPSVIPLGTKVYIVGYGFAVAEDTGGAIKGNIVDLYMDTEEECIQWGRRDVIIYILDES